MSSGLDVDASTTQELPVIRVDLDQHVNGFAADAAPRTAALPTTESPTRSDAEPPRKVPKKVSRWDRPPPPKDWRFFVGWFGQVLIALGLLTFGFVGYQLWATGIETARAQSELKREFEASIVVPAAEPEEVAVPVAELPETARPADPEITEVVPATEQAHLEVVDPGSSIMQLEIPSIDVDSQVLPTVSREDLKKGVGHFPETAMAGQLGNAAFAGHRTTYGGPFYHLDKMVPGDRVIITRLDGYRYTYAMTDSKVVDPDTYNINERLDPTVAQLTLMTCTPVHSATNRLIIYGVLVPSESGPVGEATFYKMRTTNDDGLADEAAEIAAESTDAVDGAEVPSSDAATTQAGSTTSSDPIAVSDAGVVSTTVPAELTSESDLEEVPTDDGWDGGWFEDADAWPQIGMWGAAVLALWILFRKISRWTRHYSIGFVVCIVPFLFCLYFFYQNLNRLLPPGI